MYARTETELIARHHQTERRARFQATGRRRSRVFNRPTL